MRIVLYDDNDKELAHIDFALTGTPSFYVYILWAELLRNVHHEKREREKGWVPRSSISGTNSLNSGSNTEPDKHCLQEPMK